MSHKNFSIPRILLAAFIFNYAMILSLSDVLSAEIITIAGTGKKGWSGDGGPAVKADVGEPYGVVVGPDKNLYVCEIFSSVIRKIDLKSGVISTVAGTGKKGYSGDNGPATKAELHEPYEIRFSENGNFYFVEMKNNLVRKVDSKTGIITTVAGTGEKGSSGDGGPAIKATFNQPHSIVIDKQGNLHVCDIANHRVRKVDLRSGMVSTLIGGGTNLIANGKGFENIKIAGPRAMDFDFQGNLILTLREGNKIFKLNIETQQITHIAGAGGKNGYAGDGGPAVNATLAGPKGVAVDHSGNIYFADTESHTIRVIKHETGIIETVAGTGKKGDGKDGDPLKCELNRPHSVCCDTQGNVYIGDSESYKVRKLIVK